MLKSIFVAATRSLRRFYRCLESEEANKELYAKDRATGTCDWLFSLEKYSEWASAKGSPLLWISGSPGTGKSTLCSAIIDDLRKHERKWDIIAFSFLDDSRDRLDASQHLLRTLTYQLTEDPSNVHECTLIATVEEREKAFRPMLREDFQLKLRRIFTGVHNHARVFLIIDGLDQDDWIKEAVMAEIREVNLTRKSSNNFSCAIATRDILESISRDSSVASLDLDLEPGVRTDLKTFVASGLAKVAGNHAISSESTISLATSFYYSANGLFLWLALAMEKLSRMDGLTNLSELEKAIGSIPLTVDGIYQEQLRAIPACNVGTAQKVFSWLTVANRPLSLSELKEALALDMDLSHLNSYRVEPDVTFEIVHLCGNLVTLAKNGLIRLRHPSLRNYLLLRNRPSMNPRYPALEAHELLARTCLVLLNLAAKKNADMFGVSPFSFGRAGEQTSLVDYAAENWFFHYRSAESYSRILAGSLQRYLVQNLDHACELFGLSPSGRSVQIANTILRISASYGFVSLARMCLETGIDPETWPCNRCKTPFALAAASGNMEVANLLLKHAISSASQVRETEEMLAFAAASGLTSIVKTLLQRGAKVNTADQESGRTLLHNAAASGDWNLVGLLMDYDADVNAVVPTTLETPLHLAAVQGHLKVVRYLIDGRSISAEEVESYDSIVQQPYYQSWTDELLSEDGEAETLVWEVGARDFADEHLEKLLSWSDRYSNTNMRTVDALTALDLAASKGHENVVRFLLERGATLQICKCAPYTALQAAAENGHMATVKLLLAAGADMHQRFETLGATLKHASMKGYDDIADLLVWHYFNAEFSRTENLKWSVLCAPTKSRHSVVRDSIQKTQRNKNRTKRTSQARRFPQISTDLAERPKH